MIHSIDRVRTSRGSGFLGRESSFVLGCLFALAFIGMPYRAAIADPGSVRGEASRCGMDVSGFSFEDDLRQAWTDSPYALAFAQPSVDSSQALCGRSSAGMNADFSAEGALSPTVRHAHQAGHFQVKVGEVQDFTGNTVEAGVLVGGPPYARTLATIFLVSDGKWIPGEWVSVEPGQWAVLRHRFDERNDDGRGGWVSVMHVDRVIVALVNIGSPWKGRVNVDTIRWYPNSVAGIAGAATLSRIEPEGAPADGAGGAVLRPPRPSPGTPHASSLLVAAKTPAVSQAYVPYATTSPQVPASVPSQTAMNATLISGSESLHHSLAAAGGDPPINQGEILLSLRTGVQMPGEVTPKNLLVGKTGPGFLVLTELTKGIDSFTVGTFLLFSRSDYKQYLYEEVAGEGGFTLLSLGSNLKGRFRVTRDVVLRFGATAGPNLILFSGTQGNMTYRGHGWGLNLGATAEASLRMNDSWRISAQLSFTSQIAGTLSIDGDNKNRDLLFAPLFFFSVGPEWNL
jgi:hypothetical protein